MGLEPVDRHPVPFFPHIHVFREKNILFEKKGKKKILTKNSLPRKTKTPKNNFGHMYAQILVTFFAQTGMSGKMVWSQCGGRGHRDPTPFKI